ncbi:MAG: dihydrofolate reductase [Pseudomonadota bacterium]
MPPSPFEPKIALIAAVAQNGVIGRDNQIPWRIPADLKRFKALTMGHTLIMGRRTYQSIGRALPGRETVVVTSGNIAGVATARSLGEALLAAGRPVFLAGGGRIYGEGMAFADTIYLTEVAGAPEGDAHFPKIDPAFVEVARVTHQKTPDDTFSYSFVTLQR